MFVTKTSLGISWKFVTYSKHSGEESLNRDLISLIRIWTREKYVFTVIFAASYFWTYSKDGSAFV